MGRRREYRTTVGADDGGDIKVTRLLGSLGDQRCGQRCHGHVGGGPAEECKGQGEIFAEITQGEERRSVTIVQVSGSPDAECGHHALERPEHIVLMQAGGLCAERLTHSPQHLVVEEPAIGYVVWRARRDSNPRPADPKSEARGVVVAPLFRAQSSRPNRPI